MEEGRGQGLGNKFLVKQGKPGEWAAASGWVAAGGRAKQGDGRISTSVEKHGPHELPSDQLISPSEFTREKGFAGKISLLILFKTHL